ncbi:MAG: ATP-binding protein [Verrucomicrobiota bacterium]|jgi:signal transduction histidine kinase
MTPLTPLRPLEILMVEDSPTDALLVREALALSLRVPFVLTRVESLSAALGAVQANHLDVILLDLGLPDSQGMETLAAMHAGAPEAPILVLTGLSDEALGVRALKAGAQDYLVKEPGHDKLLGRSIRYAIERHQLAAELRQREHQQAENEIQRHNRELDQRVIERTARLEAANEELEAFSVSVSHDLRAPLQHLSGFVALLSNSAGLALSVKNWHYLEQIADSAKQMGRLIEDLLVFSRLGGAGMKPEPVDLLRVVEGTIEQLESHIKGRRIRWQKGPLPQVQADPPMLRQVFINLLSNALKFTRPRDPAVIEIGCAQETATEVVILVRDNGVGFDMAYADKLFGVFQRLHLDDEFEGTGIGLANVRRIIARHGGRTWAEGKVDGGATFYFSLPKTNS